MARHCHLLSSSRVYLAVIFLGCFSLSLAAQTQAKPGSDTLASGSVTQAPATAGATTQGQPQTGPAPVTGAKMATPSPSTFLVAPALSTSGTPSAVAVADLNGDGKAALVIADSDASKISVLLGHGDGTFAPAVDYSVGKQPVSIVIADFNGDGKLDVAVANQSDGTLSVLLGNGDGTLQNQVVYPAIAGVNYLAAGDLNGDGRPDLVLSSASAKSIGILLNHGDGTFAKVTPFNIGVGTNSITIGDFDGDGNQDLALANADGSVMVLLGRGDGSFRSMASISLAKSLSVAKSPLASIVCGDFNGDGKLDLAVAQSGTKLVTVLLGNGDGSFGKGTSYTVGNNPTQIVVADVNGDKVPDLISVNQAANTFSVLLGNGDGTFKNSLDFAAGSSPQAIATGDFDGDGHIDLAIANSSGKSVSVPLGNGDGTFKAARVYGADLARKAIAVGDLDGDGKPDLVVTNFCGTDTACAANGTVSILLADADGSYRAAGSYSLGVGPVSVALADLNGDKKLDLVAANRGGKTLTVLLGNGDGTFQAPLTYSVQNSPSALAVGDFNGDGKPDLAIAGDCGSNSCSQPGELTVMFGVGDGTFKTGPSYATGYMPVSVAAGDIDGDGSLDIAIANACGDDSSCQSKGTATVLIGDGKGAFQPSAEVALGGSPSSIALGDLAGRKVLDLIVAHRAENKIAVLPGNGDGTFKAPTSYAAGTAPASVLVADFNGDGKADVAVANFKDATVSVLFGNGDRSLQKAVAYPVGAGPESLAAVQSAQQAPIDLVAANGNSGSTPMGSDVTVLRNLASSSPGNVQTFFSNLTPSQSIPYGTPSVSLGGNICSHGIQGCPPTTESVTVTLQGQASQTAPITDDMGSFNVAAYPTNNLVVGSYTVDYNYPGDATFASKDDTSTSVTVKPAVPAFSNLAPSQEIPFGTGTIPVGGTICAPTACPPMGEKVKITINGVSILTPIADNIGSFSTTFDTHQIPASDTAYPIDYVYDPHDNGNNDDNFKSAEDNTSRTVKVDKATPTFANLAPSQEIPYGTATIPVGGTICAPSACPAMGDKVKITINGVSITTPITDNNGTFSTTFDTHLIPASQTAYPIDYVYDPTGNGNNDPNFKSAEDNMSRTVTVDKATPTFSGLAASQEIPYGTASIPVGGTICAPTACPAMGEMVKITINGVSITTPITDNNGTFSATFDTHLIPASPTAYPIDYVYDPTGNGNNDPNFKSAEDNVSRTVKVDKATPAFSGLAASQEVPYGTASIPVGGTICAPTACPPMGEMVKITINGVSITTPIADDKGTFSTTFDTHQIPASTTPYPIDYNYDPMGNGNNDSNFNSADDNKSRTLTVDKATPTFTNLAASQEVPYGTATIPVGGTLCQSSPMVCVPMGETVKITINGVSTTTQITDANGTFSTTFDTHQIPASTTPYPIDYNYDPMGNGNNDSNFNSAEDNTSRKLKVDAAQPMFSGLSPSQEVPFGTVTITLSGNICAPTACPAKGEQVKITIDGFTGFAPIVDDKGNFLTSTFDVHLIPGGKYPIAYHYDGTSNNDSNFGSADTTSGMLTVDRVKPVFEALQSDNPNAVYGQAITFTAYLDGVKGTLPPTGSVTFTDTYTDKNNNKTTFTLCAAAPLTPGTDKSSAKCATPPPVLMGGMHSIVATYSDDNNYTSADPSAPFAQTVHVYMPTFAPLQSNNPGAVYGQSVTLTATLNGVSGDQQPTGNVVFTDTYTDNSNNKSTMLLCTSKLTPGSNSSVATCTPSPNLLAGSHSVVASYSDDTDYSSSTSDALVQAVARATPVTSITSNLNPSVQGQTVTFTASITAVSGGIAPVGTVTFTSSGMIDPGCSIKINGSGQAPCVTKQLDSGIDTITGGYSGDNNYLTAGPALQQTVQDFSISTTVMPGPPPVIIYQGFDNTNSPYTKQTITATVTPANGFAAGLALHCTVQPLQKQNSAPTCSVSPLVLMNGGGSTTVVVTVGSSTTIGSFNVMVTASDTSDNSGLSHPTMVPVTVGTLTSGQSVTSSTSANVNVGFVGSPSGDPNGVTFACAAITGPDGLTKVYDPNNKPYNITCTVNSGAVTLSTDPTSPTSLPVTISASTEVAMLLTPAKFFATFWMGLPAMVLLGAFGSRRSLRKWLQFMGITLIILSLLLMVGCGGGFNTKQLSTPSGAYTALIQGSNASGVQATGVVPFTVFGGGA